MIDGAQAWPLDKLYRAIHANDWQQILGELSGAVHAVGAVLLVTLCGAPITLATAGVEGTTIHTPRGPMPRAPGRFSFPGSREALEVADWDGAIAVFETPLAPGWTRLAMLRHAAEGGFGEDDRRRLDTLTPHLVRAFQLAVESHMVREQHALDTLDAIGYAAATLDCRGNIVAFNRALLTGDNPWRASLGARLELMDGPVDEVLAGSVARGFPRIEAIAIPTADHGPRGLHIVPIAPAVAEPFRMSRALVIATGMSRPAHSADVLRAFFGLSRAESELMRDLLAGHSLDEIADLRGRSRHTIRNQLKAIFAKTGSRRQGELAGLVAHVLPPNLSPLDSAWRESPTESDGES